MKYFVNEQVQKKRSQQRKKQQQHNNDHLLSKSQEFLEQLKPQNIVLSND